MGTSNSLQAALVKGAYRMTISKTLCEETMDQIWNLAERSIKHRDPQHAARPLLPAEQQLQNVFLKSETNKSHFQNWLPVTF